MSELYFRLGTIDGFTSALLADKKDGYATPIRELLQNSLDASREARNPKCEINVYIEEIPLCKIPHIKEYEQVLELAIQTAKDQGGFNENSERRVGPIKNTLSQQSVKVLMFSDNGTGMSAGDLEAILTTGYSRKGAGNQQATGSFGVGHLSSYWLSSLRYVLYATKHQGEDGRTQTLFTGQPILAGHNDGDAQRGSAGRIVMKTPDNEKNPTFEYPSEVPKFIAPKIDALDKGTVVVVLGLSEDWDEEAEYAIVSNFFRAIESRALSVTVRQKGGKKVISTDVVERLITEKKSEPNRKSENILSGKAVHQAWQAVIDRDAEQDIQLSNGDVVSVWIQSDTNADSTIVLVRNGMVVARHDHMMSTHMNSLRKNPDFVPFTAVVDVDREKAPKLFGLVKGAETPHHDKLQKSMLNNDKEEKRLRGLFKELSEKIKECLTEMPRISVDLPLFTVPDETAKQTNEHGRASGQADTAQTRKKRVIRKKRTKKKRKSKKRKKQQKPATTGRDLEARSAARYVDEGGEWRVILRVTPGKIDDKDDVYLSICLGEDRDDDQAKTHLDFVTAEQDGAKIPVSAANPSQIVLGPLAEDRSSDIIATVKKPDHIGDMQVGLLPILWLKRKP